MFHLRPCRFDLAEDGTHHSHEDLRSRWHYVKHTDSERQLRTMARIRSQLPQDPRARQAALVLYWRALDLYRISLAAARQAGWGLPARQTT